MCLRLLSLPVLFFAFQAPFPADTAQTMRQRYGQPISETYLIKPGVVASASFGASGHVCEIVVSPDKRDSVKSGNTTFKSQQLTEVIDDLVPVNERGGAAIAGVFNATCMPDNDCFGTYYDNWKITIYRNGGHDQERYATIQWTREECHPKAAN